ncbi:MAG: hypothetical protein AAFN50_01950 [Pseudomonadota bacterium]
MNISTIKCGIGVLALLALSACANQGTPQQTADAAEDCPTPNTLTCDRFNGENYNCTCQKGGSLRDMLDAYAPPSY